MKRELSFGEPKIRRDGRIGAPARLAIEAHGWHARYEFDTHGRTADTAAARVEAITRYHERKGELLTKYLRGLQGTEIVNRGEVFRIVDWTIFDIGEPGGEVELYVNVKHVRQDGGLVRVAGFPWRQRFASVAEVPDQGTAAVVDALKARLPDVGGMQAKHDGYVQRVQSLIGGGKGGA